MPQKDDSLSRLQAQLNETLERVHKLDVEGRSDEALGVIQAAQRRILGLEPALLHRFSSADLLGFLGFGSTPDIDRTLGAAELLSAEFEILARQGEADPAQAHKALELYLAVLGTEPGFAPRYSGRLDVLTQSLDYALPPKMQHALAEAYLAAGRFDAAEDALYRWRALEPDAAQGWAETFYRNLFLLSDEVLTEGGLPRDEVEEGLANVTGGVTT